MEEYLDQLKGFLASAPDAMLVVGSDGTILLANHQADELFGAGEGELQGLCVDELVPRSLRAGHAGHRDAFERAPSVRPMGEGSELRAARRDGTEFPTEISLSPLSVRDRRVVIAAVRDLTQRKAADRRLLEARLELERRDARERQALEINDGIVQSLAVAEYRRSVGDADGSREALQEALAAAREMITDLLAEPGSEPGIRPGDLRRRASAGVGRRRAE